MTENVERATARHDVSLGEIGRAVARIEAKLDKSIADHEGRLRYLERVTWGAVGTGSAGLLTAVSAVVMGMS